jgi:V/A-type H+/Na+-transporting ATPase subunit E
MAEELQNLLDRIQKDGVAKGEEAAGRIVAAARQQAAGLVKDAEAKAQAILRTAEQDSQVFVERGRKALEQAARDVVLSVEQAVSDTLRAIVNTRVGEALSPDTLKQLMVKVIDAYCSRHGDCSQIDLLVSPADQKAIVDYFMQQYREALTRGVEIHADSGVVKGFRVSIDNEQVHHEFTQKEIAEALCRLLRPRLAEIVRAAVGGDKA